ncbi:sensor histidine kinase [Pseudonocardia adelaidensis]|uniref:histidine kinase n=1 Tax=Pseudonocardia adelaidensis TaxID=648754 RepID=A0ABP9NT77_9PSEU
MGHQAVLTDALFAVVLTALAVDTASRSGAGGWLVHLVAVLAVAPIAVRRRVPVLATWIMAGAIAAYGLLAPGTGEVPGGGFGMIVGMFTVATLRPPLAAAVAFVPAVVATAAFLAAAGMPGGSVLAFPTLVLLGVWGLGDATRRWAQRSEHMAARAARAVADERVRIARELHDIVTHHMSVVSLQAGLAQYVLDSDPPTAKLAISAAGDAGRQALAEMRRLLDVLRVDRDAESDYRPQPGLSDLDLLVDRTRKAGLPVDVVVTGRARPLPPGPDLCAYRVAQESLTNILKHAGPASARIELDYGEQTLTLSVSDDGAPFAPGSPAADSHGIRGMRERAELYGGVLTAGPREQRGFAVVLRLPISEDGS